MQRLANIDKWFRIEDGQALNFGNVNPRRVRLDVNAPSPVSLFYADGDGNITFLANVVGRDVIEFAAYGEFAVQVQGGDCWFYTIDGEDVSFSIPDAVTLTKLVERRARNPELELMQHMMNRNLEARMAQQRNELEQLWSRRETARLAAASQPPAAGAPGGDGIEPEPVGDNVDAGGDKPAAGGSPAKPKG